MKDKWKSCYGCKHLDSCMDGAGGGLYKCRQRPGVVVGEWGHWLGTEEPCHPAEWGCWESQEGVNEM